jgi:hypothetical protein
MMLLQHCNTPKAKLMQPSPVEVSGFQAQRQIHWKKMQ